MRLCETFLVLVIVLFLKCSSFHAAEVSYDNVAIKINGERKIILSGSIHYPRSTPEMWPSLIKLAKEGGLNTIETYIFWNAHEPLRRQYDFSGNLDFIKFFQVVQSEGMYGILRIGPYACAEWNYGGFPMWLHNMPNVTMRTNNDVFLAEMETFTRLIVDMTKKANLFASQGGPIILAQMENEYGNNDIMPHYGADGVTYINKCGAFAISLDIGVPWIMCQQPDPPPNIINTCNGYYCDQFQPKNPKLPKFWTENWTGWFKDWGSKTPHRTAEDLAFAVARFFQFGGTLQNYYMYYGGTNFGRSAGGPYITTSYDYDAPINEYGLINQPKWGHLKQLHDVLHSIEDYLTNGDSYFHDYGNWMGSTIFNLEGRRVCFFGNANSKEDITVAFEGRNYTTPAWSVSILMNDCRDVVYNTARVSTQLSIFVKHKHQHHHHGLDWSWRWEHPWEFRMPGLTASKLGITYDTKLLDQKTITNDISDYCWYMTSVDIEKHDPIWSGDITLMVNFTGQILHAFVNGKQIGSQWSYGGQSPFIFRQGIQLIPGRRNRISLLSVTAGLQNYGAFFDLWENGILGPVKLIAPNNQEWDLSYNLWAYKVGLNGVNKGLHLDDRRRQWFFPYHPINRNLVWYKTSFETPQGNDPVVLDLIGLGKGIAWVNGHNIGRYWPSYIADNNGCDQQQCDYRGGYYADKCVTNCNQPVQRWYHVPRSFLRDEGNVLVLFEEFGGDPSRVNVHTVRVGTIYGKAYYGNNLELSCGEGKRISRINNAKYMDTNVSACESSEQNSLESIKKACVGEKNCTIDVSQHVFEHDDCKSSMKKISVEAMCDSRS